MWDETTIALFERKSLNSNDILKVARQELLKNGTASSKKLSECKFYGT